MPKHPDKLVQQSRKERRREQEEYFRPAITPIYKVYTIR